jgi:hypothetical protein
LVKAAANAAQAKLAELRRRVGLPEEDEGGSRNYSRDDYVKLHQGF